MLSDQAKTAQGAHHRRLVGLWLLAVCVLLAMMVVVGGATRLTNSGLSITEWRPVTGAIPPISQQAWEHEFDKYKTIPQYWQINRGMSLDQFKAIYWWEWAHRLLGRVIGIVFLVPLIWLIALRRIGPHLIARLVLIFALGGAQGVLGWYMVKSGLANRVEVSQYRLAAHLGLAFIIFALTLWTALDVLRARPEANKLPHLLRPAALALSVLVFCQILLGAFVAGLRAGYRFNSWPLMEGRFVPNGAGMLSPFWRNLFENPATVQFDHRIGAYIVLASVLALWFWARPRTERGPTRNALDLLLVVVILQILLGIWTLITVVPVVLGLLHQAGALALFAGSINLAHVASARRKVAHGRVALNPIQGAPTRSLDTGSSPP